MKRFSTFLPLLLTACGAVQNVIAAERVALVITNDAYPGNPARPEPGQLCRLDSVVEDRRVMIAALRSVGFEVVQHANLGTEAMIESIQAFAGRNAGTKEVLFYFSGHGAQVHGENYLCGIDTNPDLGGALLDVEARYRGHELDERKTDLERDAAEKRSVPLRMVLASLQLMTPPDTTVAERAKHVRIVLLDACRSPFGSLPPTKGMAFRKGGLGEVPRGAGLFIGFGAAANEEANTNEPGRPSLFTELIAERLQKPGTIQQVFLEARARVNLQALATIGRRQFPAYYDELENPFSFVRESFAVEAGSVSTPPPVIQQTAKSTDRLPIRTNEEAIPAGRSK